MSPVGISSATAQARTSGALFDAIVVALEGEPDLDVSFGYQWPIPDGIRSWVWILDTVSEIDPARIGPARALHETITVTVSLGTWHPEVSPERRRETFDRAFDMLGRIQTHIRENDIELGGAVLWCVPGRSESTGATPEEQIALGEYTEITATFVAQHRIRTL